MQFLQNNSVIGTLHHRANTICSSPNLAAGRTTFTKSPDKMYITRMGTQQGEDENENTSPKEEKEVQYRPPTTESLYRGAIL